MTRWSNWSGSVVANPAEIRYPTTLDEIVSAVQECAASGRQLRMMGSGHSFTPLVATDFLMMSLAHYTGVEQIDTEAVTVKGGTTIKQLGELLFEHNLAMENLGDIDAQSIAGAISTGTHGSGIQYGSIATQVVGLKLVIADGSIVECSETQNREMFKAAQVSLGALGIIVSVTLRVLPAYNLHVQTGRRTFTDCLTNLETYKRENRHFEFWWIPYTDSVMARITNITTEPPQPQSFARWFSEYALENAGLWLFSLFNRQFPASSERVCKMMASLVSESSGISPAHQIFASARLVKFQEMEYNIPAEHFTEVVQKIDETIRRERFQVHFPVECRFVKGDDIYLSPAYGRDSAYIAVHMYKGMEYRRYFDAMEAIFDQYGGRPHWGKMHTKQANVLRTLYPHWGDFSRIRDQLDPKRVFTNPYLEGVLGR